MKRLRKLSKRSFAKECGKSPRTVERWIRDGSIPGDLVFRDRTGHVFIHEKALAHVYTENNAYNRLMMEDLRVRV